MKNMEKRKIIGDILDGFSLFEITNVQPLPVCRETKMNILVLLSDSLGKPLIKEIKPAGVGIK